MCLGMEGRKEKKKARKKKNNFYGRGKILNRKYERGVRIKKSNTPHITQGLASIIIALSVIIYLLMPGSYYMYHQV